MTFEDQLDEWFKGNSGAVHFVTCLWSAAQDWDDIWDEENVAPEISDNLMAWLAFGKEMHPFFKEHASILRPALLGMWLKWQAANALEADQPSTDDLDRSFMLRAGLYDVIHTIAWLIGGTAWAREVGADIYRAYGETRASLGEEIKTGAHFDA